MNDKTGQSVPPKKSKLKQPTTWLGGIVLIGTAAATWMGKPALASPEFWQAVLTVASGIGLVAVDEAKNG